MTMLVDPDLDAAGLRRTLYSGQLILLTGLPAVADLVEHTREEVRRLFAPYDPEEAHDHFDRETMATLLGSWKPGFMHSDRAKRLLCQIVTQAGFSPETTHFDVPKPRTSFPVGHLTTGIAYGFPWHRDTWYAAPVQQINWWLPVFPVCRDNSISFDLQSFDRVVPNNSRTFDYYLNNVHRLSTASQLDVERQPRPRALGDHPAHGLVVLPSPGEILLFSGAQLHRTIPNTSGRDRYSVDFRTVDATDVIAGRGAPSTDVECTGTSIRDFHKVADGSPFDEELVTRLFGAPPDGAVLVFSAPDTDQG